MKKSLISTFIFFFSIASTFSQSNFRNGYIIKNKNDTVFGLIDFRIDQTNSRLCKFKLSETKSEKIYYPGEIAGYRFVDDGKYYVSRTVVIDSVKETVFLEYLVQGLMNLYYFPKGNGYYFFEDKDGTLVGATHNPETVTNNNKPLNDNRYIGVLSYMFRDNISLAEKTSTAEFNRKSMIEYTKEYHNQMCSSGEKCIIFENDYKKKFTKFIFSVYSGVELNTIKLNYNTPLSSIPGGDIKLLSKMSSLSPVIGLGLNISNSRISRLINLKLDVNFSRLTGMCNYSYDNNVFTHNSYNFSALKANFGAGLEYLSDKGKIRPAAELELSFNQMFSSRSMMTYIAKNYYDSNAKIKNIENELLPQSLDGLKVGIGVDYKLINNRFIVVRLLYSNNGRRLLYTYHKNFFDIDNTFQLKIGYKF